MEQNPTRRPIGDLEAAKEGGRGDAELGTARYLQRRAQFYLDFVEAENSTGFHAPQEAARILGESLKLRPPGPDRAARRDLQADGQGGRHPGAGGGACTCTCEVGAR